MRRIPALLSASCAALVPRVPAGGVRPGGADPAERRALDRDQQAERPQARRRRAGSRDPRNGRSEDDSDGSLYRNAPVGPRVLRRFRGVRPRALSAGVPRSDDPRDRGPLARRGVRVPGGHARDGRRRPRVGRGAGLAPRVAEDDPRKALLRPRVLRRADRPHSRQRHRQALHREGRPLSLDDRLRVGSGRLQGHLRHGFRRSKRPAADDRALSRAQPLGQPQRQDRLHELREALSADLAHEFRRTGQERGADRGRPERLPFPLPGRHPDRLRGLREGHDATSTSSARGAARPVA